MKLPAPIGAAVMTAIAGGEAIAGEVAGISHPLHQAIILAGALAIAIVGYFTAPVGGTAPASTAQGLPFPMTPHLPPLGGVLPAMPGEQVAPPMRPEIPPAPREQGMG